MKCYGNHVMAEKVTAEDLKTKIDENPDDFLLVDVLGPQSYEARHIPTAVNVPGGADFVERFEKALEPAKDDEIIVYCSSASCTASPLSAQALEDAGYTNVRHFSEGLAGWQDAGYEFAS